MRRRRRRRRRWRRRSRKRSRRWGQWWIVASTSAAAHTVVEAEHDPREVPQPTCFWPCLAALTTGRKGSAVDFESGPWKKSCLSLSWWVVTLSNPENMLMGQCWCVPQGSQRKRTFRALPESWGGSNHGRICWPFFHEALVSEIGTFLLRSKNICIFVGNFCHHYH